MNQASRRSDHTDHARNNTSYADVLKKSDDYRQTDASRKQTRYDDVEMIAEGYSHDDDKQTPLESYHYDLYSAQQYEDHTNYCNGTYTKQYIDRSIHPQNNQQRIIGENTAGHINPKN